MDSLELKFDDFVDAHQESPVASMIFVRIAYLKAETIEWAATLSMLLPLQRVLGEKRKQDKEPTFA